MTIWLGSWLPVIVVSSGEAAWEVLVNKSSDYAARALPDITKICSADWKTIHASDAGQQWYYLRKGLQSGALGPLNISMQSQFHERDMKRMIDTMHEEAYRNNGIIINPFAFLKRGSVHLLCRLCFGVNFEDDKFAEAMEREVEEIIHITDQARIVGIFGFTRYIPRVKETFQQAYQVKHKVEELRRPYLSSNPPPSSYLHFLLSQNYPEQVIIFTIFELFLLGIDSTSATTTWALAFLIHDKKIQQRLYQDIIENSNGGTGTIVRYEELSKLHYLQAIVKETMRMKPIAPLALPHKTVRETKLMGRTVPKGTSVMVNLYAIHYNPKIWVEPHKFMPERFLSSQSTIEQSFIPFGAGMRACAGMELGKLQLAFALANLVNAFEWSCTIDGQLPDLREEPSVVLLMKTPLVARILPRQS